MIGGELQNLLEHYKDFGGIYTAPFRNRCKKGKLYILNSSPYPGTHWLAYDLRGPDPEFFDSFGHSIEYYGFSDIAAPCVKYSTVQLQQNSSDFCGAYCVMYSAYKLEGRTLREFIANFQPHQLRENDSVVINWLKHYDGSLR